MGGIVVNELFNLPEYRTGLVDLVISLSTPHAMPPTPFSRNMASLYDQRYNASVNIAVSGGSADSLLPADVTYAPIGHNSLSILSTSIPGVWAPISHQAIVWCDQLRRKLARAVLLSIDSNKSTKLKPKESVLNIWQKSLTGIVYENTLNDTFDVDINASMSSGTFTAVNITRNSAAWSLGKPPPKWVTGDVAPTIRLLTDISPEPAYKEFEEGEPPITILGCKNVRPLHSCRHLSIKDSAVMPYLPRDEKWLPVRHGADEEQSLYMLDADSDTLRDDESVVVLKTNNNRKGSWMTSQFAPTNEETRVDASFARLLFSSVPLISQTSGMLALRRNYRVVNAPATSLLVYKIEAEQSPCVSTQFNKKELFQPLLKHVVESTKGLELTYHPSLNGKIMLESHLSHSPYLTSGRASNDAGLSLEIFADTFNTESCFPFQKLTIGVDILASIAKWGTRYRSALIGFALGIWCVAFRRQLKALDSSGTSENFIKSLTMVFRREMIVFSFVLVISILVSSSYSSLTLYFIGLHDIRLWFIAPLLLLASYGLVSGASVVISILSMVFSLARIRLPQFASSRKVEIVLVILNITIVLVIPQQVMLSFIGILSLFAGNSNPIAMSIKVLIILLSPFYIPMTIVWIKDPLISLFGLDYEDHNPLLAIPFTLMVYFLITNKQVNRLESSQSQRKTWLENIAFFLLSVSALIFSGRHAYIVNEMICILIFIVIYTRFIN